MPHAEGSVRRWIAGAAHEPRADAEAAGRIVVPGDHHRGHAEVGEPVQRVVEQLDGGQRRYRPVVHVPRHHHRVHLALAHGGDEVTDELGLGAEHADPVEGPAEVPVGGVQESHGPGSVSGASDSADGCSRITRHVPAIGMSDRSGANHPWCPHRPPASPACAHAAPDPRKALPREAARHVAGRHNAPESLHEHATLGLRNTR